MLWSAIRSAPRPGVSLFSGTVTDTILPLPSSVISTLNGAKPVTSYVPTVRSLVALSSRTVSPTVAAACFSASLMALLVSVTPLFTSICAVAIS